MACSRASRGLARSTASPVVVPAAGRRLARTAHPACRLAPGPGCASALRRFQRCSGVALPVHSRRVRPLLRHAATRRDARRQHRRPGRRQRTDKPPAYFRRERHAAGARQPAGGRPATHFPGVDRRHLLYRRQQRTQRRLQSDGHVQRRPGCHDGAVHPERHISRRRRRSCRI